MKNPKAITFLALVFVLVTSCNNAQPTPVAQIIEPTVVSPTEIPTNTPVPQPTVTATSTATSTPTFTATATFTPTPTLEPVLSIVVKDKLENILLADIPVQLDSIDFTTPITVTTSMDGAATFTGLTVGSTYTMTVQAEGYIELVLPVVFDSTETEIEVALEQSLNVIVTQNAALREGPGTIYGRVGVVQAGEKLQVIGQNDAGDWLLVITENGDEVWIATSLIDTGEVDLTNVMVVVAPPTPTPSPTTVAIIPQPPVQVPVAGNLLVNPGFENGIAGWDGFTTLYNAQDNPQFVHSGSYALLTHGGQNFVRASTETNVIPGQTYRAGVWVKIWSSSGENRLVSENPGDFFVRLCINPINNHDPNLGSNVCTGFVRPLDTWQYLSVDAVAVQDTLAVNLHGAILGPNVPVHNEAIWDDVSLVAISIAATPTPAPAPAPQRPSPIPFDANALYNSMLDVESVLNQMGGLLDRLYNGSRESCVEYEEYYRRIVTSATYHSLPEAWNGPYNEYIFAVENTIQFNETIFAICQGGGGSLTNLTYSNARSSIAVSLERLIPAVQQANALLEQ